VTGLLEQPWFWPSVIVIFGLPLVLVLLTEWHSHLDRIGSRGTRVVTLLRDYVAPVGALWLLLTQTGRWDANQSGPKLAATVFAFLVILVLLNALNFVVFTMAKSGTRRERVPTIIVDLVRLLIIVIAGTLLLGLVWDADVSGMFTALGVGSIVVGLALQNAVGGVISGLLLLFEQPFGVGDWIRTGEGKGRVIEINWRAVHLDTLNGIRVIPNSQLAGQSFVNLSRAESPYSAGLVVRFATDDPPDQVIRLIRRVAADLPFLAAGEEASAVPLPKASYEVSIPLANPGKEWSTVGLFRSRLWYAARRAGLHLDRDLSIEFVPPEAIPQLIAQVAAVLHLDTQRQAEALGWQLRVERYQPGETVQRAGEVPDAARVIVEGLATMSVLLPDGSWQAVVELDTGDLIGLTCLTRQAIAASVTAERDLTVLVVPAELLEEQVRRSPELARDFGREIDRRREAVAAAYQRAGLELPSRTALIAF
jgi:small-conductance mechanosensitive channel